MQRNSLICLHTPNLNFFNFEQSKYFRCTDTLHFQNIFHDIYRSRLSEALMTSHHIFFCLDANFSIDRIHFLTNLSKCSNFFPFATTLYSLIVCFTIDLTMTFYFLESSDRYLLNEVELLYNEL